MISKQQIQYFKGKKKYFENKIRCLLLEDNEDNEDEIDNIKRRMRALYLEERAAYSNDLVQPDDSRFQTLYRNEWLKAEKRRIKLS